MSSSSSANLLTIIARVTDSMILVATMDEFALDEYKSAADKIIKTIKSSSPLRCTIDASPYYYHYIIESGAIFLTLVERNYPKRLAFAYLEELAKEFLTSYGEEVSRFSRPYAVVAFEPKLNRLRRSYLDSQSAGNMKKLNSELGEIHNIMQQNINEVIQRGEKLEVMETRSAVLLTESKKYQKLSRYVNLQALYKTLAPIAAIVLVVLIVIYLRFLR